MDLSKDSTSVNQPFLQLIEISETASTALEPYRSVEPPLKEVSLACLVNERRFVCSSARSHRKKHVCFSTNISKRYVHFASSNIPFTIDYCLELWPPATPCRIAKGLMAEKLNGEQASKSECLALPILSNFSTSCWQRHKLRPVP